MPKWLWWVATAVFLILVAAALNGPLFPWSPVKPGYTHFTLHRADIYYPSGTQLEDAYQRVDTFIAEAEKFHRLKMPGRSPAGARTLQTGTVIFVTPKIAEKHFDTAEYLRHELSHAIIDQNTTLWRGHKMNDQPWLFEGLAVDFGRQKSYLTEAEFVARAMSKPLTPAFNGDNSDMRFNYVAWRYFLEYMMKTRGRDKFQDYLLRVMQEPDRAWALFPEFFRVSFDQAVLAFQESVRSNR